MRLPGGRRGEAGWSLPFALIFLVIIPAVLVVLFLGWRRLWIVPVFYVLLMVLFLFVDRWERGKEVPEEAGPVPQFPADHCPRCEKQAELVDRGGGIYGLRCPHCGHQEG